MLIMELNIVSTVPMLLLLLIAAVQDSRNFRIPNIVSLGGAVLAAAISFATDSTSGLLSSSAGWLVGLALFLPLYMIRAMGAGDVKLVAMVGSFTGYQAILPIVLYILVCGGVLAVGSSLRNGKLAQAIENAAVFSIRVATPGRKESLSSVVADTPVSGKIPYAIPILSGTVLWTGMQLF